MRAFDKGHEPHGLRTYRTTTPGASYAGWATGRDEAQRQLCVDQGYLCAYCMGRIEPDGQVMTIEHYCSQHRFPARQLDWQNMLGVCPGEAGEQRHCDSSRSVEQQRSQRQDDPNIGEFRVFDPLRDARHAEGLVSYNGMGEMTLREASPLVQQRRSDIEYDLFTMLNLNCKPLQDRRRVVLDTIREQVMRLEGRGRGLSAAHHRRLVEYWSEAGRHHPYFMVALDWLEKHPPRR